MRRGAKFRPARPTPGVRRRGLAGLMICACWLGWFLPAGAQTTIDQNNLLTNGGFDDGSTGWTTSSDAVYFYDNGAANILSLGWSAGNNFEQNTGTAIQSGVNYVLTICAAVGQSPVTGVNLELLDETASGLVLTNAIFNFPNQSATWRTYSLVISSNLLASRVGDILGVEGVLVEVPSSQQGWLWVDWLQLAPASPALTLQPENVTATVGATAVISASAIGAVTNASGAGSVIQYQWYEAPNHAPVTGGTNATLFFPVVALTNAGAYSVVASGPFGSNASSYALLNVQPAAAAQYTSLVDPNQTLVDNFVGWGTSLCWWANVCGGYSNRNTYAALAFTTLGLNIVRYNIGGGENPNIANTMEYRAQMPGFEPTNGIWNWNADQNQRWMLRQAVALGANHVVAFANSPPWWMTVSGSVTGSTNGTSDNLQSGYETNFAQYLATVVSHLTASDGVTFNLVTPMNEPDGSWWVYGGSQEGCHMDPSQQARMVNDLRAALTAQNLSPGIDASEDTDEQDTINAVSSYSSAETNVTIVASHTYSANNPAGLQSLAQSLGVPDWISEYSDGDGTGITMARRIHDDITQAGVSAWTYWQVVDNYGGWGLLYNPEDDTGDTNFSFNEKFFIMWQFSHFLRPGCEMIAASDTNSLAGYDPVAHKLCIVALNDSADGITIGYNLGAFSGTGGQAGCWRTSPYENTNALPPLTVSNRQFTAYLAADSVTTFVISNVYATQPVAWYPVEGNGLDATGNGNNAILVTNAAYVTGKIGAFAAQFSGNPNSYMVIPRSISNSFTITCWVKTPTTGGVGNGQWWNGKGIVDGEVPGTTNDFGLTLVGNNAAFGIGDPDTTISSTNAINDGNWHHLAAAWDNLSGQMQLYVDGVAEAETMGPTGTRTAPPSLRLGGIQPGYSGGFLAGAIDDVQLFGRVLSSTEVVNTMNHAPSLLPLAPISLLAGVTLNLTNTAVDPTVPAETLTWSLLNPPVGMGIIPLGLTNAVLTWRPAIAQAPSTNWIGVAVTDNGTPQMSATQTVAVTVLRPVAPQLSGPLWRNGALSFSINGQAGPDYILDATTNLGSAAGWTPVVTNFSATLPWTWSDPSASNYSRRYYRVQLGP